jgi:hypothetical protein
MGGLGRAAAALLVMVAASGCYRRAPPPPQPQPFIGVELQGPQIQTDFGVPHLEVPVLSPSNSQLPPVPPLLPQP